MLGSLDGRNGCSRQLKVGMAMQSFTVKNQIVVSKRAACLGWAVRAENRLGGGKSRPDEEFTNREWRRLCRACVCGDSPCVWSEDAEKLPLKRAHRFAGKAYFGQDGESGNFAEASKRLGQRSPVKFKRAPR